MRAVDPSDVDVLMSGVAVDVVLEASVPVHLSPGVLIEALAPITSLVGDVRGGNRARPFVHTFSRP